MKRNRRPPRILEQAAVFLTAFLLATPSAEAASAAEKQGLAATQILRLMLDAPPLTLNPRMTQDVQGQRINALLFPALTKQDHQLRIDGDLAESIEADASFSRWQFKIRPNVKDHAGNLIGPKEFLQCINNYRQAQPLALSIQSLEPWKSLELKGQTLTFKFDKPEPYFSRNISVIRYFRQSGHPPCAEPVPHLPIIGAGEFRAQVYSKAPDSDLTIERLHDDGGFYPHAQLIFIRDENTRLIRMLRGQADIVQNAFSPTRFRWIAAHYSNQFRLIEAAGVNVSYLSFNVRHPILSNKKVRKALSLAVPVGALIRGKFGKMVEPASSFISPILPDGTTIELERENPAKAKSLLDEAGYPIKSDGTRFTLRFKTTPVREGYEPARVLQESFEKIGIKVILEVVEPAVFLASVRRGNYELSLGRWVGVADPSLLERTLRSQAPSNRAGYSDPEMDQLLDSRQWLKVQKKMAEDLPYFPLWFWKNAVLIRNGITGIEPAQISLTGALRPLLDAKRISH
ncbi:MAG: ABC transporter substrate-binding protein [Bdellovibrionales bacterium]|nr:ABC transporter substrate-binding protein [Bdellovibrionales bacterium]